MVAVKVGGIAFIRYDLEKMTLWQASKYFIASGKASLAFILFKQSYLTFLATGSLKITASSVRKAGIMLGVIPLHVISS